MKLIDLHGMKHEDIENDLILFLNENEPPVEIITGNSRKMKDIVAEILKEYKYYFYISTDHNFGSLIVTERQWTKRSTNETELL